MKQNDSNKNGDNLLICRGVRKICVQRDCRQDHFRFTSMTMKNHTAREISGRSCCSLAQETQPSCKPSNDSNMAFRSEILHQYRLPLGDTLTVKYNPPEVFCQMHQGAAYRIGRHKFGNTRRNAHTRRPADKPDNQRLEIMATTSTRL
jgi:hypothetical protein